MPVDWDREVAAMDNSLSQRVARALPHMASTDWHGESAVITVKMRKAFGHFDEDAKVLRVRQPTLRPAMRRDDLYPALQRQGQCARIAVLCPDDRQRVFAAGMRRQLRLGHSLPEPCVAPVAAVDILAVGQAFHHHCAPGEAALQFFECVGPGRMNRNGRQEFGMPPRQGKHVLVRHIKRASARKCGSPIIVDLLLC